MPAYFKKKSKGAYNAMHPPGKKAVLHKGKKKHSRPGVGKPHMK